MRKTDRKSSINRRAFVKLLPAAGAAGLTISGLPLPAVAQTPTPTPSPRPSPTPPLRITKDMMHNAEKLIGIELTDKQEDLALPGVNRNLDNYEAVRKIEVPLDTEPAIAFHPAQPGFHIKRAGARTKFRFGKNEPAQFKSVEDLAFATVPQLAELIRTKKVSSVELTKMYLGRLKRYGPRLFCIVTLTEDELAEGVRLALRATHNLAEGAGAAPLMAAMKLRDRLAGKKIVCVMSGANIDTATLRKVLG